MRAPHHQFPLCKLLNVSFARTDFCVLQLIRRNRSHVYELSNIRSNISLTNILTLGSQNSAV
jgi:hypothetical protein